jgi:hypothetical protein
MSATPIFPDCAFPDDCLCAARGYEHERDSCAVPHVIQSAKGVGLNPEDLAEIMDLVAPKSRPKTIHERGIGSLTLIGNQYGDFAADLRAALREAGAWDAGVIFSLDELRRIHKAETISAGLRAEAGYGSPSATLILAYREERLTLGSRIRCWLTVSPSAAGDAVFWNVIAGKADSAMACASWRDATLLFDLLREAGGEGMGPAAWDQTKAPTDDELREMGKC